MRARAAPCNANFVQRGLSLNSGAVVLSVTARPVAVGDVGTTLAVTADAVDAMHG